MYAESDFLAEIRQTPLDDAPRLVFADWLEERGDPRGELIRLQCLPDHPEQSPEERAARQARERELTKQAGQQSLQTLQAYGVTDVRFRRGFIEKIRVEGTKFLDLPRPLVALAPTLSAIMWRSLPVGKAADAISRLLNSPHFPHLRALDLSQTAIGTAAIRALATGPRTALLQTLNLEACGLAGQGLQDLLASPLLTDLQTLNLDNNELTAGDARVLGRTKSLRRLTSLSLNQNRIGDEGLSWLAAGTSLANLETLSLANNGLGGLGLKDLVESPVLQQLSSLNLSFADVGQRGAMLLGSWSAAARLKTLNLSHCRLGADGVEGLTKSLHLRHLTSLDLSWNDLSHGARLLADSPNFAELQRLDLSHNGLDARTARTILEAPLLEHVAKILLGGNPAARNSELVKESGPRVSW